MIKTGNLPYQSANKPKSRLPTMAPTKNMACAKLGRQSSSQTQLLYTKCQMIENQISFREKRNGQKNRTLNSWKPFEEKRPCSKRKGNFINRTDFDNLGSGQRGNPPPLVCKLTKLTITQWRNFISPQPGNINFKHLINLRNFIGPNFRRAGFDKKKLKYFFNAPWLEPD